MRRAIVTGGAGFIGSHLVDRLVTEGWEVIVLDNMHTGQIENINPAATFIKVDVGNPDDFSKIPGDGVDVVFHLAAQSSGEASFDNPYVDFRTNAGGTLLMLEWCRQHAVKRFIYTSSMAVYGINSSEPLGEDDPCRPLSFYGAAKLASEGYCRLYDTLGLETTIIRPFNVYGSRQNLSNMKQGMASIYMAYLLRNEPIVVKGDLDRFRDQTHISDVVEGFMCCVDEPAAYGNTYNIATGRKTTVRSLIRSILLAAGREPADYTVQGAPGTPGDIFGCYADISKASNDLGWQPVTELNDGLREMYRYYSRSDT